MKPHTNATDCELVNSRSHAPYVSVIIPCRNEEDYIEPCIRSILAQRPPFGGFEIIVADGMSSDGTPAILKRLSRENPSLRVIANPRRIVSSGLNEALKMAKGNIIVRMDAHTEYAADYLQQCIDVLCETGADNVGGPWCAVGSGFVSSAIAAAFQSAFGMGRAKGHDPNYEGLVDTVYLGCWPREVFGRIGTFDEELVRNQDDEFNLRLTRYGGRIWQSPRIKSCYRVRGSLRLLWKQYKQYGYWKVRVIQKHKVPASFRHLVPGCFVASLLALPVISAFWQPARWIWTFVIISYMICNITASVVTAARTNFKLILVLPVTFACYHISYGYGFMRGVFDFFVSRSKGRQAYTNLSRGSRENERRETV
jgi:succinoglycan biosynthesis protein ExoA